MPAVAFPVSPTAPIACDVIPLCGEANSTSAGEGLCVAPFRTATFKGGVRSDSWLATLCAPGAGRCCPASLSFREARLGLVGARGTGLTCFPSVDAEYGSGARSGACLPVGNADVLNADWKTAAELGG